MEATRDFSNKQEKKVAKLLGGVQTSNSGATPFTKGDVVVGDILVECKTKVKECTSFSIQQEWLKTLEEERRGMRKRICALAFSYDVGESNYYVIDERTMKRLAEIVNGEGDIW